MDNRVYSLGFLCLVLCTGVTVADVIFCESSTGHITCPQGQRIVVYGANFGRTQGSEICGEFDNTWNTQCYSRYSYQRVYSECNNRRRCEIDASVQEFGDPCPGIYKYLEVNYVCRR